ncbi:MAG: hypothetical protein EBR71_11965 [Planctomycetes bacterium]|nr:hypothetical protein [Planctomycetota bacterium]
MSQSLTLAVASAIAISGSAMAGIFGSGNVVVERVGDGTAALSSAATAVSVIEMSKAGVTKQQLDLPTSGSTQVTDSGKVTDSGSATSNGYLNVYNGLLAVSGYNAASGTASVAASNTKVGTVIGSDGNVSTATRTLFPTSGTMPFTANNFRSMIATGANTFYASGTGSGTPSTGGIWYANNGSFTQISSTTTGQPTNMRNVEIYGGNLYTSSAATTGYGVWQVGTGLATTAGQTSTLLINAGAGASTYGFVLFDTNSDGTNDLAYLADDRTTAGGGLQKWVLTGGTWTNRRRSAEVGAHWRHLDQQLVRAGECHGRNLHHHRNQLRGHPRPGRHLGRGEWRAVVRDHHRDQQQPRDRLQRHRHHPHLVHQPGFGRHQLRLPRRGSDRRARPRRRGAAGPGWPDHQPSSQVIRDAPSFGLFTPPPLRAGGGFLFCAGGCTCVLTRSKRMLHASA